MITHHCLFYMYISARKAGKQHCNLHGGKTTYRCGAWSQWPHLGLDVMEGVDEHLVGFLQPLELPYGCLKEHGTPVRPRRERRHAVGAQLDAKQSAREHIAAVRHRQRQTPRPHLTVDEVHGARLRQERRGRHASLLRHPPRPRQVRVVHQHADRSALPRLRRDEVRQRLGAHGLETAPVLRGVGTRGRAAVVKAVGDGCHPEWLAGRRGGGEHVPGGDERGAQAVVGQAAAELEQRVGVALPARVRQQQDVRAGGFLR
jgi:hypothetical protein